MAKPEEILAAIDTSVAEQEAAQALAESFLNEVKKRAQTVAAHETSYDLQVESGAAQAAELEATSTEINLGRVSLNEALEDAISAYKLGYKERSHQRVLKSQLANPSN